MLCPGRDYPLPLPRRRHDPKNSKVVGFRPSACEEYLGWFRPHSLCYYSSRPLEQFPGIPPVGMYGGCIAECAGEAGTHRIHDAGIERGCGGMVEVNPAHDNQYTPPGRGCQSGKKN